MIWSSCRVDVVKLEFCFLDQKLDVLCPLFFVVWAFFICFLHTKNVMYIYRLYSIMKLCLFVNYSGWSSPSFETRAVWHLTWRNF